MTFAIRRSWRDGIGRRYVLTLVLPAVVALALWLAWRQVPVERSGQIALQVTFEGADRNRYPNETRFAGSEMASRSILAEVYSRMQLQDRIPMEDFAAAFYVSQSSAELERVHAYYRALLASPDLSPVDRIRIEEEYRTRLSTIAGEPGLVLGFRQRVDGAALSPAEVERALREVIEAWARSAVAVKGATRFDVEVASVKVSDFRLDDTAELPIALDALHVGLLRVLSNLEALEQEPAFKGARLGDGRSLADLRAEANDLLQLKLHPLLRETIAAGAMQDRRFVTSYYQSRLGSVQSERERITVEADGLRTALRAYSLPFDATAAAARAPSSDRYAPTLVPPLDDRVIERLIQLSDPQTDVEFRMRLTTQLVRYDLRVAALEAVLRYYQEIFGLLGRGPAGGVTLPDAERRSRASAIAEAIAQTAAGVERLYSEVSRSSLGGQELFRQVRPFSYVESRAFDTDRARLLALMLIVAAVFAGWFADRVRFPRAR